MTDHSRVFELAGILLGGNRMEKRKILLIDDDVQFTDLLKKISIKPANMKFECKITDHGAVIARGRLSLTS